MKFKLALFAWIQSQVKSGFKVFTHLFYWHIHFILWRNHFAVLPNFTSKCHSTGFFFTVCSLLREWFLWHYLDLWWNEDISFYLLFSQKGLSCLARVVLKLKTYIANVLEVVQVQQVKKEKKKVGFKSVCNVEQCARIGLCTSVTWCKKTRSLGGFHPFGLSKLCWDTFQLKCSAWGGDCSPQGSELSYG